MTNCRLREELEAARAELAALKQPLRVPFSDAQINDMVLTFWACYNTRNKTSHDAIRAALAAGGLEPCPVTPSDDEVEKLARVLCDEGNKFGFTASWASTDYRSEWIDVAREAIAHLRPATSAALHPGETVEGVIMARDHYRVQLEREQEWTKQYKQDRDDAVAELAAVKQERDELCDMLNPAEFAAAVNDANRKEAQEEYYDRISQELREAEEMNESLKAELEQVKAERSTWRVGHDLANERVTVLESELAAVKAERDRLNGWYENAIGEDEVTARKGLRARLGVPDSEWPTKYIFAALDERDALKSELAALRDEIDDDNTNAAAVNDLLAQVQNLTAERNALRQRASVPVKVRWDVTAEEASREMREKFDVHCYVAGLQIQMDYLAAHAVIDVPAGVPSVEELHDIGEKAYHRAEMGDMNRSRVVAIRDRVLVGVAGERMALTETGKPVQWTPTPTDAQIEALVRVMEESVRYTVGKRTFESKTWAHIARAAFAHIGAVPGVDPDAWKTPLEIRDSTSGWVKTEFPNKASILLGTESSGVCLTPSDAARLALWLASYAAAHGCPVALPASETPKGLPSIDDIAALIWESDGPHGCNYNPATCEHTRKAAEIAFTALAPYLREPVGWELDVTKEEMYSAWHRHPGHDSVKSMQSVLDLCRSRIRPVFECKECAEKDEIIRVHNKHLEIIHGRLRSARAALEVE